MPSDNPKTSSDSITLMSWNVNGMRAICKKGFPPWLDTARPDILCLQETRCRPEQLEPELREPDGYRVHYHPAARPGYSGTAIFSRTEPNAVYTGLGDARFDDEGRTIIAEYDDFTVVNCYFPNGGRDHSRVPFKLDFCEAFIQRCEALRAGGRGVIFCGDVNTSHKEIDLARPGPNKKRTGFLPEERAWIDRVVEAGWIDTFRLLHPEETGRYTWWHMVSGARARNVGWRLDYFFVSPELKDRVLDAFILDDVLGSDHCPVGLTLAIDGAR